MKNKAYSLSIVLSIIAILLLVRNIAELASIKSNLSLFTIISTSTGILLLIAVVYLIIQDKKSDSHSINTLNEEKEVITLQLKNYQDKERLEKIKAEQEASIVDDRLDEFSMQWKDKEEKADEAMLRHICFFTESVIGLKYIIDQENTLVLEHKVGVIEDSEDPAQLVKTSYTLDDGLIAQALKSSEVLVIDDLPEGYITVGSGLGESTPNFLAIIPLLDDNEKVVSIIELASFAEYNASKKKLFNTLSQQCYSLFTS